ncbi:MAG: FixH family protein [Candidatus Kapabacteria bacterium]|jgi:hypothetical protein|nr:FixH family protein [Candidatus Kapabacteria bacterium]
MTINWGWRIAIVYTVFAIATLGMVAFTLTKEVDLVRSDYYEYTLDHNKRMERLARAETAGAAVVSQDGALVIAIPMAVAGSGSVEMLRPSSKAEDRTITFDEVPGGEITIRDLLPGRWDVVVRWNRDGRHYELNASVVI